MQCAPSRVNAIGLRLIVIGAALAVGAGGLQGGCGEEVVPLCAERVRGGTARCEVASVSCDGTAPCPASWTEAQATTACDASTNEITIGACGALRAWKISGGFPPLFVTCTYDPTDGHLAGILHTSDSAAYCDNRASELSYGTVPLSCAPDPNALTVRCH